MAAGTTGGYFQAFAAPIQMFAAQDAASAEIEINNLNSRILQSNINQVRRQAMDEERRIRDESSKILGQMRASYGASGVTMEGSPLEVLRESAKNAELDALYTRYAGEDRIRQLELEIAANKRRSESAQKAADYSNISTLFNLGGSLMGG